VTYDALGPTPRGTPTDNRSDISVTLLALSHLVTAAGTGGMACVGDLDLGDRCLLRRRWGRRSEVQIHGSTKGVEKLSANLADRQRNFARPCRLFSQRPDVFVLPRTTAEVETARHMFPVLIRPGSGVERAAFQAHIQAHGIDTRMVWIGNALRQPAFRSMVHRAPASVLPNTDRVMEQGLILPSIHLQSDDDIDPIWTTAEAFLR
jgi:CDP-6-deoxy-D-xylo-4-hexulose-3-dehydrase